MQSPAQRWGSQEACLWTFTSPESSPKQMTNTTLSPRPHIPTTGILTGILIPVGTQCSLDRVRVRAGVCSLMFSKRKDSDNTAFVYMCLPRTLGNPGCIDWSSEEVKNVIYLEIQRQVERHTNMLSWFLRSEHSHELSCFLFT